MDSKLKPQTSLCVRDGLFVVHGCMSRFHRQLLLVEISIAESRVDYLYWVGFVRLRPLSELQRRRPLCVILRPLGQSVDRTSPRTARQVVSRFRHFIRVKRYRNGLAKALPVPLTLKITAITHGAG